MILRHTVENTWTQYLSDTVNALNNNYIFGSTKVTPARAHKNKTKYDEIIRDLRAKKIGQNLPNTFVEQKRVIKKYLRSRKSKGRRIGDAVTLNFFSKDAMTKSFDFQVLPSDYFLLSLFPFGPCFYFSLSTIFVAFLDHILFDLFDLNFSPCGPILVQKFFSICFNIFDHAFTLHISVVEHFVKHIIACCNIERVSKRSAVVVDHIWFPTNLSLFSLFRRAQPF